MLGSFDIKPSAVKLVQDVEKLVSLPEVCFLINDLVNDPNCNVDEIGHVISQDPDLTVRLLKLVNSSLYGFSTKIDTVSRAVLVVGLKELQHVVWASSAVETFSKLPPAQVNMAGFWRHSIFSAVVARILAKERDVLHPERLFVAGLLHDIGRLLIYTERPIEAKQILDFEAQNPEANIIDLESEALGFDHAEVAAALMLKWNLPYGLCEAVRYHHQPSRAKEHLLDASIVHVANIIAHALESGEEENELKQRISPTAWELLEIPENKIKRILHDAVMQFLETLELLLPGASQKM